MNHFSLQIQTVLITLCFSFLFTPFIKSQSCLPNGIRFSNQSQIDNFPTDHANCTNIEGTVTLDGLITNLDGLAQIQTISGDLVFEGVSGLQNLEGLNQLTQIGGSLIFESSSMSSIEALANLEHIGDNLFVVRMASLENLKGLEKIDSIFGSLALGSNPSFQSLSNLSGLDNLKFVGGNLSLTKNMKLQDISALSNLEYVGGIFGISENDMSSLEALSNLKHLGSFVLTLNESLTNLKGLENVNSDLEFLRILNNQRLESLEGLEKIGSIINDLEIELNSQLKTLTNFPNMTSVGRNFIIERNRSLENIDGFNNITSIGNELDLYDNQSLVSIDGFSSLKSIGGFFNLSSNPNVANLSGLAQLETIGSEFSIVGHNSIISLDGLDNLKQINGRLTIRSNTNLENMIALNNLRSINGRLDISSNPNLTSLEGLNNLDPQSIFNPNNNSLPALSLDGNSMLSDCAVFSVCGVLNGSENTEISFNAPGCNNESEINCSNFGISGDVFYDTNENGIQDSLEYGIGQWPISFVPTDNIAVTDQDGSYFQIGNQGAQFVVEPILDPEWIITTDSMAYSFRYFNWGIDNINKDFGLVHSGEVHDMEVVLSSELTRCNTEVPFYLDYVNKGSVIEAGQIVLALDPQVNFISATPNYSEIDNNIVIWNYEDLRPFENRRIELILEAPDETATGNFINFTTEILRDSSNVIVPASSDFYESLVRCSYDPNDKGVTPKGEGINNELLINDLTLDYLIRFQNTGNDVAIDVSIKDTLDDNLDWSTFKVLSTSHQLQTYIDGPAIEFLFKDIYLIDSLTNEPESHGFIRYRINAKADIQPGTTVENTAYIIFDQNAPIITNTTKSTFVDKITSTYEFLKLGIKIYPNPAQNILHIESDYPIQHYQVFNALGQLSLEDTSSYVDCAGLMPGHYQLIIRIEDKLIVEKFVVVRR